LDYKISSKKDRDIRSPAHAADLHIRCDHAVKDVLSDSAHALIALAEINVRRIYVRWWC
jgi:hypothetical protein